MNFINIPNLPIKKVKAVLISSSAGSDILQYLEKRGVEAIIVPPCRDIASQVSTHPDMLFHHLGNNKMVYYKRADSKVCQRLVQLGFELTQSGVTLKPQYPNDIALNSARVGNYLFCNEKFTDKTIINYCKQNDVHIVPLKQGYSRCSICIVNENSMITADKGIALAAEDLGLNVLLISAGFIDLSGYNTGFIGGCCGKISNNKIIFSGDISKHSDYLEIKRFLDQYKVEYESIGSYRLLDIGSIIPLTETD
jgi:hypothetical protein